MAPARSTLLIVIVAATVLSLCMGVRQSLGLFLPPIRADLGVSATAFGFAMAIQTLVWGLAQPVVGALGDRFGARPVLVVCALVYVAGLLLMGWGGPVIGLNLGGGVLVGIGIAGCGFGVVLGAVSRAVPAETRVQTLGLVAAAGSVATLAIAPAGQLLITDYGWQAALLAFALVALAMAGIAVLIGGKPVAPIEAATDAGTTAGAALATALRHPGFVAMSVAFFACGFQLMYITFHLPSYLALCGVPQGVSAMALGVIGIANAVGSYTAGLLGARYSQKRLLALVYLLRTAAIVGFLAVPISPLSTLVFAGVMGFLWLSVVPLVSGLIGRMFGLRNFNLLFGIAFLSHQVGGFLGAWLGGLSFDLSGAYDTAWGSMIVIGSAAFVLQWFMRDGPSRGRAGGLPAGSVPAR